MEPYQQRVVEELASLEEKIDKLRTFFESVTFVRADETERYLLGNQYGHMLGYRQCLQQRIQLWNPKHEPDTGSKGEGQGEENHQGCLSAPGFELPD